MGFDNLNGVTHLKRLPPLTLRDVRDHHYAKIMIKAVTIEPLGTRFSALAYERLAKASVLFPSLRIARGNDTSSTRFILTDINT